MPVPVIFNAASVVATGTLSFKTVIVLSVEFIETLRPRTPAAALMLSSIAVLSCMFSSEILVTPASLTILIALLIWLMILSACLDNHNVVPLKEVFGLGNQFSGRDTDLPATEISVFRRFKTLFLLTSSPAAERSGKPH